MNKIFKKMCGTLCIGIAALGISNVNAASNTRISFDLPNDKIPLSEAGDFNIEIAVTKYTDNVCDTSLRDINGDGETDGKDALTILKHVAGMTIDGINDSTNLATFMTKADMNCDGTINEEDGQIYLMQVANMNIGSIVSTITSKLTSEEIDYIKYLVINGDSKVYTELSNIRKRIDTIIDLANSGNVTAEIYDEFNKLVAKEEELEKSLSSQLITSKDSKTISGNIGTKKVDTVYIYVTTKTTTGETESGLIELTDDDDEWDTYFKSLESNSSKEDSNNSDKADDKTNSDKVNSDNNTNKENNNNEETVKNPTTGIAIPVIGGAIVLSACLATSKKKNLFKKI